MSDPTAPAPEPVDGTFVGHLRRRVKALEAEAAAVKVAPILAAHRAQCAATCPCGLDVPLADLVDVALRSPDEQVQAAARQARATFAAWKSERAWAHGDPA